MQYLRGMQDLTPMIEPGEQPNWWVESLYTGGWTAQSYWQKMGRC